MNQYEKDDVASFFLPVGHDPITSLIFKRTFRVQSSNEEPKQIFTMKNIQGQKRWRSNSMPNLFIHHMNHFLFFSSVTISWTGAAGILIHHSFNRLISLSLLNFLNGISLVNVSINTNMTKCFRGMKANTAAPMTKKIASLSVAWKIK